MTSSSDMGEKDVIESEEFTNTTGAEVGISTYLSNLAGCPIETINIDHIVNTHHETFVKPNRQAGKSLSLSLDPPEYE
jgi:hypothetical protein